MQFRSSLLFFVLCLCMIGCYENDIYTFEVEPQIHGSSAWVTTSILGQVIDENEDPINGALVMLQTTEGVTTVKTDEAGQFLFEAIANKSSSAFITVSSSGKFEGFRRLPVFEDRYSYTKIKLATKKIIGKIDASKGGILETSYGASINLPADGIVDQEGSKYLGEVNVAMRWIDPSDDDLSSNMIGDLSGIDEEGVMRALATYGMLQIELLDDNSNKLNLGNDQEAILQFPVPETMRSNASDLIPLWSYDEEVGVWIEEGIATYEDGSYIGAVTHFSSWNVDKNFDPIDVYGRVAITVDKNKADAGYMSISVESENIGKIGGWLCDDGSFSFYNFPKDEIFKLTILDKCNIIIYEQTYGPYDSNIDLGSINIIPQNNSRLVMVHGEALGCKDEPIYHGGITVSINENDLYYKYYKLADDGSFNFSVDLCENEEAIIKIYDKTYFNQSEFIIENSKTSWELRNIKTCDEVNGWLQIAGVPNGSIVHDRYVSFTFAESAIVAGGSTEFHFSHLDNVWEYNDLTSEWTELGPMPYPKDSPFQFSIEEYGYLVGGSDEKTQYTKDFIKFDSKTKLWEIKENYPGVEIRYGNAFVINGKGYMIGGKGTDGWLNQVWMYDPESDSWEQKNDFPGNTRRAAVSFSINGEGYYGLGAKMNGTHQVNYLKDFWKYDPEIDKWTQIDDFPGGALIDSESFVLEDAAYVGGGHVQSIGLSTKFYKLDPLNYRWERIIDGPGSGDNGIVSTFVLNNIGYLGYSSNQFYAFKEN